MKKPYEYLSEWVKLTLNTGETRIIRVMEGGPTQISGYDRERLNLSFAASDIKEIRALEEGE